MVLMCMPYAGQTEGYAIQLENAATVISIVFMVEMTLKLIGHGCADYWADGWYQLETLTLTLTLTHPNPNSHSHLNPHSHPLSP